MQQIRADIMILVSRQPNAHLGREFLQYVLEILCKETIHFKNKHVNPSDMVITKSPIASMLILGGSGRICAST